MGELISNSLDKMLLDTGLDGLSVDQKNDLIVYIAKKDVMSVMDVDTQYIIQYHKNLKINLFSNLCEDDILNGFTSTTTGYTYRLNRDDQLNFLAKYVMVKDDDTVTEVYWKTEDTGNQVSHTKADFLSVVDEGFDHKETTLLKYNDLRSQVKACTTDLEVFNIQW